MSWELARRDRGARSPPASSLHCRVCRSVGGGRHHEVVKRDVQTPKRCCMFCGGHGRMSKEHAWPRWLGRDAAVDPLEYTYRSGFSRTSRTAFSELSNESVQRPGSVLTSRIREVCTDCNGGWMSRLEEAARPILQRLWAPQYPLGLMSFSQADCETLGTWAAKTAWVRERTANRSNTADPAMRQRLAATSTPPELTTTWVGRHHGQYNFTAFNASLQVSHQDQDWATAERRQVQLCVLVFRGLAVLVRTDSGDGVPPIQPPAAAWTQVWPRLESMPWPPITTVTDEETYTIAKNFSSWVRLPDVPDFRRSGPWRHVRRN